MRPWLLCSHSLTVTKLVAGGQVLWHVLLYSQLRVLASSTAVAGAHADHWPAQLSACVCLFGCPRCHRSQGQPIKAACAALMVHDVSAAVTALHLGNEPEQAAMLCIALGRTAGLQGGPTDRVFEALAVKYEAAGANHGMHMRLVKSGAGCSSCWVA